MVEPSISVAGVHPKSIPLVKEMTELTGVLKNYTPLIIDVKLTSVNHCLEELEGRYFDWVLLNTVT